MTDSSSPDRAAQPPVRRRISLALALVGGITLLILLSVGSVLYIGLSEATENTFSLLADKADSNLDLLEAQLETRLGPTEAAGTELAGLISEHGLSVESDFEALQHMLRGSLVVLPRATAVIFAEANGPAVRIARVDGTITMVPDNPVLLKRQQRAMTIAARLDSPSWIEPIWIPAFNEPVLSFIAPVRRNGEFAGAIIIITRLGELAQYLAAIEAETGVRAFILYDNRYVLGHPELTKQDIDPSQSANGVALPTIETFHEDAFRLLHKDVERAEKLIGLSRVHDAPIDDEFILLIREIHTYGSVPWQIALRYQQAEVTTELTRLRNAAIAGLVILFISTIGGYLFVRGLNRQIARLAEAATRLQRLDVTGMNELPDSRIRELSNAARAFNALIGAMRWFETYVPKTLVLRLMHTGVSTDTLSDERALTIMFSDIRGFSTLVEHMDPAETAALLNRHFSLLADCIEAEGGTVDKFIGDSIMAFWGAPEEQADHAARALRAAAAMQAAMVAENDQRRTEGLPVVAIRLGVHTGPVVVGNIGSASRINYTVIGDSVNVAARLESFAKELGLEEDCVTLISGVTLAAAGALPEGCVTEHLGDVPVRGRDGTVDVYRLTV